MIQLTIPVDHGNRNIKTDQEVFNSSIKPSSLAQHVGAKETLLYKGITYAVEIETLKYRKDKTENEEYFLLTLIAIGKYINRAIHEGQITYEETQQEIEVTLLMGTPPEHIASLAPKYKEYFCKNVEYTYNGTHYHINITRCFVFPQGFAALFSSPETKKMISNCPMAYIIDIGGFTVDALSIVDNQVETNMIRSLERGVLKMFDAINSMHNTEQGSRLRNVMIEQYMQGKATLLGEDSKALIEREAAKWVEQILYELREENETDFRHVPVFFIGGGSMLLRKYIEENKSLGASYFIDDLCANAKGYLNLFKYSGM